MAAVEIKTMVNTENNTRTIHYKTEDYEVCYIMRAEDTVAKIDAEIRGLIAMCQRADAREEEDEYYYGSDPLEYLEDWFELELMKYQNRIKPYYKQSLISERKAAEGFPEFDRLFNELHTLGEQAIEWEFEIGYKILQECADQSEAYLDNWSDLEYQRKNYAQIGNMNEDLVQRFTTKPDNKYNGKNKARKQDVYRSPNKKYSQKKRQADIQYQCRDM